MKKRFLVLLTTVLILVIAESASAVTTYSNNDASYIQYDNAYIGKTIEGNVILRTSAYAKGQIIDTLKKGIKLYVNGAKYDADGVLWYEVSTTCRKDGWVLADSVGFEEQADARYDSMLGSIGSLLSGGSSYIGNVKTHVYHLPGCRVLPNPENRTYFENKRQAEREGYRACGVCKP